MELISLATTDADRQEFVPLRGWYEAIAEMLKDAMELKHQQQHEAKQAALLSMDVALLEMTVQHSNHVAWTLSDDGAWIVVYRKGRMSSEDYPQYYIPAYLVPSLITPANGFSPIHCNLLWEKYHTAIGLRKANGDLRLHRRSSHRSRRHRPRFQASA